MELTEGHLIAWIATAQALKIAEPSEIDLLPDIAAFIHTPTSRIGSVPGAFDFDAIQLQSVAATIFSVVALCMSKVAPKIFEAALDVGKDSVKKLVEQKMKTKAALATTSPNVPAVDLKKLRELVRVAALERRLSPGTADAIANAVIAQFSIASKE